MKWRLRERNSDEITNLRPLADPSENEQVEMRRSSVALAIATVATAAVAGVSASSTPAKASEHLTKVPRARLVAPRDATVLDVKAKASVLAGDEILSFDPAEEDQALARIDLARKMLELQEKSLGDTLVQLRKKLLLNNVDVAKAYNLYALATQKTLEAYGNEEGQGTGQPKVSNSFRQQGTAIVERAKAEVDRANAAIDLFIFNTKQTTDQFALIKSAIPAEQSLIQARRDRLTLRAPIDGTLVVTCFKGSFAAKGSLVAEIY